MSRELELFDVGPVVFPAYEGTSSDARGSFGVDDGHVLTLDGRQSPSAWNGKPGVNQAVFRWKVRTRLRVLELDEQERQRSALDTRRRLVELGIAS